MSPPPRRPRWVGPRTVVPTLPLLTVTLLIVSGTGGPAGAGTPVGTPTVDPWFDGPHGAARPASPASVNNATWNWTNFANVTPGYDIPARAYAGLAAYPPGNEVIAFGGAAANGTALGDTWAFGPNWTWTPVSASTAPSARVGPLMAYDAPADAVILFGGRNGSGTLLRDTWSFSGGQWTLLRTGPPPPARSNATLVPDANGTGLILFGGNGSKGLLNDTWWFNETGGVPHWTNLTPTAGAPPPARYAAACANLSAPAEDVLYGGNSTLGELADTWVFNGSVWRAVTTRSNPGVRAGAAMGFDQVDGVDVLFGGYSAKTGTIIGSTSVFNGSAWNVPNIGAVHPHPRVGGAMAWAGGFAGGIALLLGGTYGTGTALGGPFGIASLIPLIAPAPQASVASTDPGGVVTFTESPVGGVTPYRIAWHDLPTPCDGTTGPNVTCRPGPTTNGSIYFQPWVTVTDARNVSVTSPSGSLTINGPLTITGLSFSPDPVDVGAALTVSVQHTGGAYPLKFVYAGLPSGCVSENLSSFTCTPTGAGSFDVNVTAVDPYGENASLVSSIVVRATGLSPQTTFGLVSIGIGLALVLGVVLLGIWRFRSGGPANPSPPTARSAAPPTPPADPPRRGPNGP